jgi:N-acetylglucosaminyl-diphospho-decaprenol L-rhamnosyltransferase
MENLATTHIKKISISVVSHAQIHLVSLLLQDLTKYCHVLTFEVILALNLTETLPFSVDDFAFPIKIIHNTKPRGGVTANHNQAFTQATGAFFV